MAIVQSIRLPARLLLLACLFSACLHSQDQATLLYNVKNAEIQVSTYKLDYETKETLFKEGLLSAKEFEDVKNRYLQARLSYVYALIRATSGSFYVSVERAEKYQKPDGTKWVKLTLLNSLPDIGKTIDEFLGMDGTEEVSNYKELYNNEIRNVFLSIEKDGILAGQPLEYKINALGFGEKRDFEFQIMRDMDEVEICIRYDLHSVERRKVILTPSGIAAQIVLTPENFSVESNLGNRAVYKVLVERYMMGASVVKLSIPDLSSQLQWDIYDGQTRISDINFRENDFKKELTLNIHLPPRESQHITMDTPIEFHLVASEQATVDGKPHTIEGRTKLVLIPRGIGEIEIKADNLFQESSGSAPIKMPIRIANNGSRDILDITLTIRGGSGWENTVDPIAITSLQPQREGTFNLLLAPPANVHPGEYDFRVAIRGLSDGKTVYAEEKTFRVKINARTNWIVVVLGTLLSLGLIGGAAYGAIRIMKN
ncbi:MAG: NEW3 domain-containing protein [Holophagaceae bacterium]|nr:NEW3 domain-containing protein [Holophagaceae bacterium]